MCGDGSREVMLAREIRDSMLSTTKGGRFLIDLYYKHAAEIETIIREHSAVRRELQSLFQRQMPVFSTVLNNRNCSIDIETLQQVCSLCDTVSLYATVGLKDDMLVLKKMIRDELFLRGLGLRTDRKSYKSQGQ